MNEEHSTEQQTYFFLNALSNLLAKSSAEHEMCMSLLYSAVLFSGSEGGFVQSRPGINAFDVYCGVYADKIERDRAFSVLRSSKKALEPVTLFDSTTLYSVENISIGLKQPLRPFDYDIMKYAVQMSHAVLYSLENIETFGQLHLVDRLTGLLNMKAFERHLRALAKDKVPQPHAVLYVDLEGFTEFNKKFGYEHGDEALKSIAWSLKNCVDKYGRVFRFKGDEFCVIVNQDEEADYEEIARRVQGVAHRGEEDVQIFANVGVSEYRGQNVKAMLEESGMGRDTVERFFERRSRARNVA